MIVIPFSTVDPGEDGKEGTLGPAARRWRWRAGLGRGLYLAAQVRVADALLASDLVLPVTLLGRPGVWLGDGTDLLLFLGEPQ